MAHVNQHGEQFSAEEQRAIAPLIHILLSVGASWEHVRMELARMAVQDGSPFKRVPSQSTCERMLLAEYGYDSLTEYKEKAKDSIRSMLKNKAVHMALQGHPAMLIFCLKNLCGWSDNIQAVPEAEDAKNRIRLAYDPKGV